MNVKDGMDKNSRHYWYFVAWMECRSHGPCTESIATFYNGSMDLTVFDSRDSMISNIQHVQSIVNIKRQILWIQIHIVDNTPKLKIFPKKCEKNQFISFYY